MMRLMMLTCPSLCVFLSEPEVTQMVSGNTVEYDLKGLQPATEYTLSVHALKDTQRSETLSTHFTTGATPPVPTAAIPSGPTCSVFLWCCFLLET